MEKEEKHRIYVRIISWRMKETGKRKRRKRKTRGGEKDNSA